MERDMMLNILKITGLFLIAIGGINSVETSASKLQPKKKNKALYQKKTLLQSKPKTASLNEVIELRPLAQHHFNLKAPHRCGELGWLKKTPLALECQMSAPGPHAITVSICDDQVSFCKTENFIINVTAPPGFDVKNSKQTLPLKRFSPEKPYAHSPKGFLTNTPEKAKKLALKEDKLLFIDFFGTWCPPCNLLDELVFNQKEFLQSTQNMVKVRLDADSDLSWEWKAHFKVRGYPTLIIANAQLEEIGRLVGYRPLSGVVSWTKAQEALKNQTIPQAILRLEQKDLKEPAVLHALKKRVGLWHFERGEYPEAISLLGGLEDPKAQKVYWQASVKVAKKDGKKESLKNALTRLLNEFPTDIEVTQWVLSLAELDLKTARRFLKVAEKSLERWKNSPELGQHDYTLGDLLQYEGFLYQEFGDDKKSKNAFAQAAIFYEHLAKQSSLKVARGANLEQGYCLVKSGQTGKAIRLYEKLSKTYSDEFAFNYNYAWALREMKKYGRALTFAKKAVKHSYGDNWLRAVGMEAKIKLLLGNASEAKEVLETTLKQVVLPKSTDVRTHRYLSRLRGLLKEADQKIAESASS